MVAASHISLPKSDAPIQPDWPVAGRYLIASEEEMDALAARLTRQLRRGDTLLLSGGVGAGKTHLARAVIRAWLDAPHEPVPSPTFTLVQTYGHNEREVWHADLYRLGDPGEIAELGLEEAFGQALCLIEWPDRMAPDWPEPSAHLFIQRRSDDTRSVTVSGQVGSQVVERIASALAP